VSILAIEDGGRRFVRCGGASIGGATFFGLAKLLAGCRTFDEAIALAAEEEALVGLIRSLEIEAARAAGTAPSSLIWPASGWVSSEFGIRWGRNHNGIDIAAPTGTQVRSAARGTVRHAGPMGSFGNLVIIDHGGGVATLYAHLHSVGVREGQRVDVNEPIATVGSTGRSTGPHLHFEVRRSGKAVNPRTLLR